jgi:hypothetical protein
MRIGPLLVAFLLCAGPVHAADEDLNLPVGLATVASFGELLEKGWILDVITHSQPEGTRYAVPIIALRSAKSGPTVWIISGIHGEEPAGPNAIAAVIDDIARLGDLRPVVLIPLANPHGYARNWRYLNSPTWSEGIDAQSVGDSSHLLPDPEYARQARATVASSPEAGAITRYITEMMYAYPPAISIDLHEDDKLSAGYVYSQGINGATEPLAIDAVQELRENAIPIQLDGHTRFDEEIEEGIIGPVTDSSIDELMSAKEIIVDGEVNPGPSAPTVLVFETPAGNLPLARRTGAHEALLRRLILLNSDPEN